MSFDLGFGRPTPPENKLVVNHGWEKPGHAGMDIGLPSGTPLIAVADGTIIRSAATNSSDAGIHVDLLTSIGALARYLHMSQLLVKTGDFVTKGQLLGYSGNTGLSTGPHLHFETRVPPELLGAITEATGTSTSQINLPVGMYLVAIPSEPWLPVDSYSNGAIANARNQNIPLYTEIPHEILSRGMSAVIWAGLATIAGVFAWRRWFKR